MYRITRSWLIAIAMLLVAPLSLSAAQATPEMAAGNPFGDLDLPQLDITITDSAFEGVPAELASGRYLVSVTGALTDEFAAGASFLKLPESLTTAEFVDYVSTPPDDSNGPHKPQPWYYDAGHAGAPYVLPGQTRYAVVDLTAGDWVYTAEYRVAPQAPVPFTVTGEFPQDLPEPKADFAIEMDDYGFSVSGTVESGTRIVQISNTGDQHHFLWLVGIPDGSTSEDFRAFAEWDYAELMGLPATPMATGPLAGFTYDDLVDVFSTTKQSSGVTAWYAIDLAPGTYGLLCYERDSGSDVVHAALGQAEVLVVK